MGIDVVEYPEPKDVVLPILERKLGKRLARWVTITIFLGLLLVQFKALPEIATVFNNQYLRWWAEGLLAMGCFMAWCWEPSHSPTDKIFLKSQQPFRFIAALFFLFTLFLDVTLYFSSPYMAIGTLKQYTSASDAMVIREADLDKILKTDASSVEYVDTDAVPQSESLMMEKHTSFQGPVAQLPIKKKSTLKEIVLEDCIVEVSAYRPLNLEATSPLAGQSYAVPPVLLYVYLDKDKPSRPHFVAIPDRETMEYTVHRWGAMPVVFTRNGWDYIEVRLLSRIPGIYTCTATLTFTPDYFRRQQQIVFQNRKIAFIKAATFDVAPNDYYVERGSLNVSRYAESLGSTQIQSPIVQPPKDAKGRWVLEQRVQEVLVWHDDSTVEEAAPEAPPAEPSN